MPFTTIRGRTLGPPTDEFVGGGDVARLGYTDRLFEPGDGDAVSLDGQRRIWVVPGASVSVAALVTALV